VNVDKRKLASYAFVAFVLGSLLGGAMWNFVDITSPVSPLPQATASGTLKRFSSYEELKTFLNSAPTDFGMRFYMRGGGPKSLLSVAEVATAADSSGSQDFSGTNIQVEGVDEADLVKTDGEYIYLALEGAVLIVKAYPPEEAEIVSRLELNQTVDDLYVNGDKLVVFLTTPVIYYWYPRGQVVPPRAKPSTTIRVYDISDRASPALDRSVTVDGCYFSSRMIGNHVYAILDQPAYLNDSEVDLPTIRSGEAVVEVEASSIYYSNHSDCYYAFTNIVAVNVQDPEEQPSHETFLLGAASELYVSPSHIYITTPWFQEDEQPGSIWTMVYKVRVGEGEIAYAAEGSVPGWALNQFSMDEHGGYFRIATTNGHVSRGGSSSTNNVYILNASLGVVGRLEGLAPGEEIYSARFMGGRCYLVTFRKVDPLFAIDLSDPEDPRVLGKLKIPGYSDYLHPYDETHLIGVGKETEEAEEGDFAWYQGVKISLFDVSDVSRPRELAKFEIGDRGTDSPVLRDHRAFLFSRAKSLLVIPVLVAEIDPEVYSGEVPPNAHGDYVYQGAYVFHLSPSDGIRLRGRVTHLEGTDDLLKSGYYFESRRSVKRALYIDDVLYTISDGMIKMNSLVDLEEINRVTLS